MRIAFYVPRAEYLEACPGGAFASKSRRQSCRRARPTDVSTCKAACRRSRRWSRAGCANIPSNGSGSIAGGVSSYLPVLIRVHSRFINRVVAGSWASMV